MTTETQAPTQHRIAAGFIAFVMLLLALSMWTVIPLIWLWIGSQLAATQFPSLGPYAVVLFGVIVSILFVGWLLGLLNEVYLKLTGVRNVAPIRLGWLKSLRDSQKTQRPPSVLETVIVGSALIAAVALLAWFFTLAGSPISNGA
ncbi:MAG TPA: hypothetical protein VMF31_03170 [Solirubrobacterales bacterium]|nr:hypothetical protein [Solirubrobacterales bacterium]